MLRWLYDNSGESGLFSSARRAIQSLSSSDNATAPVTHQGFVCQMKDVPGLLRLSLTYDRSREMACHKDMAADLNLTVYFADLRNMEKLKKGWLLFCLKEINCEFHSR